MSNPILKLIERHRAENQTANAAHDDDEVDRLTDISFKTWCKLVDHRPITMEGAVEQARYVVEVERHIEGPGNENAALLVLERLLSRLASNQEPAT